ncbi:MAG: hypothetical protein A2144_02110 [Chloroflexi bacterium RBG_16_50_9]|nr:MAG: hypothetical protein A2144_02110 [Chloroflexi bacterium RBG_16_50_9]
MRKFAIVLTVVLILGGIVIPLSGCSDKSSATPTSATQIITVQSGNISTEITAAGNLALSRTENLALDLFYPTGTKGTVGDVLVEEGDTVKEGDVLVTMDKDEWNDQLSTKEDQVTTAERNLLQTQANLLTAQQTLESIKDTTAKEKTVLSAEVSLQQAQDTLDAGITATDYQSTEAALNKAKAYYSYVKDRLQSVSSADDWLLSLQNAQDKLDAAQTRYDNVLSGYDSSAIALKKKQVEIAELTLALARKDLADVSRNVAMQELQVKLNEGKVADAQKALEDARGKLEEAQSKSPEIKAPFDGFITSVNVAGGDEVLNGTVAVTMADPNKFEAAIVVSEMDIMQVKLGGDARIQLSALTGINFPAKVTFISPTATIQSGVVNYKVKVELQPLVAAASIPPAGQSATPNISFGQFQGPQSEMSGRFPSGQGSAANLQLKDGLTATVSIIVSQKNSVLLVPNAAITSQGGKASVHVMLPTGATEARSILTGITDYQNTEVIRGLTEGEKVIVPQGVTTSRTTTSSQQGTSVPRMPFLGPPPR